MLKTTNIVLIRDYNIDYLNQFDQNHLDLVLIFLHWMIIAQRFQPK